MRYLDLCKLRIKESLEMSSKPLRYSKPASQFASPSLFSCCNLSDFCKPLQKLFIYLYETGILPFGQVPRELKAAKE